MKQLFTPRPSKDTPLPPEGGVGAVSLFICRAALVTLSLVTLLSCTERISIDTDNSSPTLVIYGVLTDEFKFQEIKISHSSPYFDDEPNRGVTGAIVTVQSSAGQVYRFFESNDVKGLYYSQSKFGVRSEDDYSLSVEVDFNGAIGKYEATTNVPPAIVVDSLTIQPEELFGHKNHILYANLQDPPGENFYLFKVLHNDSLVNAKLTAFVTSDDALFDNQYLKSSIYLFDDISEWEKDTEERRKQSIYLKPGDKIELQTSLITKEYFDFIRQCRDEKNGENPLFGGPPSNIVTNISNGARGYFSGYVIGRKSIVFEDSQRVNQLRKGKHPL
jgi:hypothetical protein